MRVQLLASLQRRFFQHSLEAFAGTGFTRHLQFLENAQRYAREYREFVENTDRSDPESLHLIGVPEGMSKKPVSPEAIPKFEDTLNLSKDFNAASDGFTFVRRCLSCGPSICERISPLCALRYNK